MRNRARLIRNPTANLKSKVLGIPTASKYRFIENLE